jgi:hypothetical protein
MSYWHISQMSSDPDLTARVQACAAQEMQADPFQWTATNMLRLTAQPEWDVAWGSAEAAEVENPGRDPGVITDQMILSSVQAVLGGQAS